MQITRFGAAFTAAARPNTDIQKSTPLFGATQIEPKPDKLEKSIVSEINETQERAGKAIAWRAEFKRAASSYGNVGIKRYEELVESNRQAFVDLILLHAKLTRQKQELLSSYEGGKQADVKSWIERAAVEIADTVKNKAQDFYVLDKGDAQEILKRLGKTDVDPDLKSVLVRVSVVGNGVRK